MRTHIARQELILNLKFNIVSYFYSSINKSIILNQYNADAFIQPFINIINQTENWKKIGISLILNKQSSTIYFA